MVCWIIAEVRAGDGLLQRQHSTQQRLAAAAVSYHISRAQMQLAALIVGGNRSRAARLLGISINTARIQLRRMFAKTE